LQNGTICPISASGSNFNPRNIQYIPVVEIIAFLELEQKLPFFKGLFSFKMVRIPFLISNQGKFLIVHYTRLKADA